MNDDEKDDFTYFLDKLEEAVENGNTERAKVCIKRLRQMADCVITYRLHHRRTK